jgi:two-component system OmpR family sensor kinase
MTSPFRRTPLRLKLVASAMALLAVAVLVIGVSSAFAMRSYLVGRLDSDLRSTADVAIQAGLEGLEHPQTPFVPVFSSKIFVQLIGPSGLYTIYNQRRYQTADLPTAPKSVSDVSDRSNGINTVPSDNGQTRWREFVTPFPGQTNVFVLVGGDLSDVDDTIGRLVLAELLVGAGVLILLGVAAAGLVRANLRPLREIEHTAAAIAKGDLTRRVPEFEPGYEEPRTEVGHLSRSLNTMLGQIEAAFTARAESESRAVHSEERMRQFVADASHELRTPLTTIRGFAELYRQGAFATPEDAQRLVRRIEDEASRMGLLVEDLLLLARLDMARPLTMDRLDLRVIGNDAVIAAYAVAPDRDIALDLPEGTGQLEVEGDEARLRQVVGNLMTNALVHTPAGTPVTLRMRREPGQAVIEVVDAGPGLSPEQIERVFERFYRADAARTPRRADAIGPSGSGTGLGLAIVAALVAAHRGVVEVDSGPGRGATFRVRLPLAAPAPPDLPERVNGHVNGDAGPSDEPATIPSKLPVRFQD